MIVNELIPAERTQAWIKALDSCGNYDIYHLPQYHLLAEKMGEGSAFLFYCTDKNRFAALPFLLRSVEDVEGLKKYHFNDITSVYGYPGIVTNVNQPEGDSTELFRSRFQNALQELFKKLAVVAFFSRTNPLVDSNWLFKGMGEGLLLSQTVAIDLSKTDSEQLRGMTKGHRYDIRKSRKNGVVVEEDSSFSKIDEFIEIYNKTMERNLAGKYYFFPKEHYLDLKKKFGKAIRLYFARLDDAVISTSMFFFNKNIIQYHLSGSVKEYLSLNGAKLILDEVRLQGTKTGFSWLHLGGGVGSSEDSLFRFKAGFSKIRLPFQVIRMVVDKNVYSELCDKRTQWAQKNDYVVPEKDFFPYYRL